jgi:hypothetical protein
MAIVRMDVLECLLPWGWRFKTCAKTVLGGRRRRGIRFLRRGFLDQNTQLRELALIEAK